MSKTFDWSIEDCQERLIPSRGQLARNFTGVAGGSINDDDVTDRMLSDCYVIVAQIVEEHGEHYLPLFQRLQKEIDLRKQNKKLLRDAKSVAFDGKTDFI